ncbi:recombinase family protein [Hymenobacter sp. B1770]|uniref:recombinase family protein n=1 Tax=Hymenobacter sp. B1770 TaxID=1718788 RepID=UPI003CF3DFEE
MKSYVTYLRVSTDKQGASGLGLEAQRSAVASFAKDATVAAEYVEVESGKNNTREKLAAAIAYAKKHNSVLLIAKLDRLSRNAAFIFTLRDSGVNFIAADIPDANSLTIGIFATLAQHERETIAKRTKDALAAKRARGEQLGNANNLTAAGRVKGQQTRQANAKTNKANVQAAELIKLHSEKGKSLREIAACLNSKGYTTRRGCQFTATAVQRLLNS